MGYTYFKMDQVGLLLISLLYFPYLASAITIKIAFEDISPAPDFINIQENKRLSLSCSSDNTSATYFWKSDAEGFGTSLGPSLIVPSMRPQQSGRYYCHTDIFTSASVMVHVLYTSTQPVIQGPVTIISGSNLNLTCASGGYPTPTVYWTYQENIQNPTKLVVGETYTASNVVSDLYLRCYAENTLQPTLGGAVSKSVHTDYYVRTLHPAHIWELWPDYWGEPGQRLNIRPKVAGEPYPDVRWSREKDDWELHGERLFLDPFTVDDVDVYTCHASNNMVPTLGESESSYVEKKFLIHVFEPGNKWRCYRFTAEEENLISNPPQSLLPNVKRSICERHKGFVYNNGDYSRAPGCFSCECCQPDEFSPFLQDCLDACATDPFNQTTRPSTMPPSGDADAVQQISCSVNNGGLIAAAVIGWLIAVALAVVLLFWCIRIRRHNFNTESSSNDTMRELSSVEELRIVSKINNPQQRALPHPPLKKRESEHIYLDVSDDTLDNSRSKGKEKYDNPEPSSPTSTDGWGYMKPTASARENNSSSPTTTGDYYVLDKSVNNEYSYAKSDNIANN